MSTTAPIAPRGAAMLRRAAAPRWRSRSAAAGLRPRSSSSIAVTVSPLRRGALQRLLRCAAAAGRGAALAPRGAPAHAGVAEQLRSSPGCAALAGTADPSRTPGRAGCWRTASRTRRPSSAGARAPPRLALAPPAAHRAAARSPAPGSARTAATRRRAWPAARSGRGHAAREQQRQRHAEQQAAGGGADRGQHRALRCAASTGLGGDADADAPAGRAPPCPRRRRWRCLRAAARYA